jgi:hypothetical protein
MASSTIFITAADARQNPLRETVIHDEARAIESSVLEAVKNGFYQATLKSGSPMTSGISVNYAVQSLDLSNDQLYIPNHPFKNGDLVTVSSNGVLPGPLNSTDFYSVIYVDVDHIKLSINQESASLNRPLSIDFGVGVVDISLSDQGAGYLTTPRVTIETSPSGDDARASAILATWGSIDSISVLSAGRGYNDVPSVTIVQNGIGAVPGPVEFKVVAVSVSSAGSDYRIGDILSVSGGVGTSATVTVRSVTGTGSVTAVGLGNPGSYSALPTLSSVDTTVQPGGGTGCTLNISMGLNKISVSNGGTGYTAPPVVTISGDARAQALISAGKVVGFQITNPGSDYTTAPSITLNSGSGAAAIAVLQPTAIDRILVTSQGSGYVTAPTVTVESIGSGAVVDVVSMVITSATLTNAGGGYSIGDTLLIAGGDGSANAAVQVTSIGSLGQILSYVLITSGSYTQLPVLNNNNVIGGTGRSATFNLKAGVGSITLGAQGAGYTTPPHVLITSTDGNGSGAAAYSVIDGDSVDEIIVTAAGTNYTSVPEVTITSGSGAVAVASISDGLVTGISLVSKGEHYTCIPNIVIEGDAQARAVLRNTGVSRIQMIDGGDDYVSSPMVYVVNGDNQEGSTIQPSTVVNIGYSLDKIVIDHPGSGYSTAPIVSIALPQGNGSMPATAVATLGSGIGTMVVSLYPDSRDYWKVWKNQEPSNQLYVRPYTERMDTVIAYFTSLGYSITRQTNPDTGNTLQWTVMW